MVELPAPEPGAGEVLIEVRAAVLNAADVRLMRSDPFFVRFFNGLWRPRIRPGADVAGVVRQVGAGVEEFAVGDEVFGDIFDYGAGAVAEYATAGEDVLVRKPENVSFVAAAALPVAGLTALQRLRDKGGIVAGQRVLIYGASGSVGTYAVQLAKHRGAHVTGVCSTRNLELVRGLGADEVIDYTAEDSTARDETCDVIFDAVGKLKRSRAARALKPGGVFLSVMKNPAGRTGELELLRELSEAGVLRPVIDGRYPLEEIVAAHRYVETDYKRGNVVEVAEPTWSAPAGPPLNGKPGL